MRFENEYLLDTSWKSGGEAADHHHISFQCTKRDKIISINCNTLIDCFDDKDVGKAKLPLFEKLLEKKKNCQSGFVQLLLQ